MIATNDTGPLGGTADIGYEFTGTVYYDSDISERNRYIHECRMKLFASFGAVVRNCWQILYWPALNRSIARPVLDCRPQAILAGVMSRSRGIHWNRNKES